MYQPKLWVFVLFLLILGCARREHGIAEANSSSPIYDEKADARRDIAAAIANAKASKKNVVLIFGANW